MAENYEEAKLYKAEETITTLGNRFFNTLEEQGKMESEDIKELRRKGYHKRLARIRILQQYPDWADEFPDTAAGRDNPAETIRFNERLAKLSIEESGAFMTLEFAEEPLNEALAKINAEEEASKRLREEGGAVEESLKPQTEKEEPEEKVEVPFSLEPSPPKEDKDENTFTAAMALADAGDLDEAMVMLDELSRTAKSESMRKRAEEELLKLRAKKGL